MTRSSGTDARRAIKSAARPSANQAWSRAELASMKGRTATDLGCAGLASLPFSMVSHVAARAIAASRTASTTVVRNGRDDALELTGGGVSAPASVTGATTRNPILGMVSM